MSATARQTLPYEPHLDGLRGLAVLLVVLFHAFPDTVPGGWIGVDVFFVLSGFLITRLIVTERDEGRFAYSRFLIRRVRRLAPAFLLVAVVTLAFAWEGLFAEDFVDTASAAAASILLSANWYFFANSGYFDADAQANLFLHAWSLSIEEQFYLVYPFVLIALPAKRRRLVLTILFGLAVVAAFYSGWALSPSQTFFATQARVWELLAGAMVAVWGGPALGGGMGRGIAVGALLVLIACGFVVPEGAPLPIALLPVIGATALLLRLPVANPASLLTKLLSARGPVWLGRISYSLYLWHWPVLVGIRHAIPQTENGIAAIGLVISAALATLTYVFVEQPVRRGRVTRDWKALGGAVGGASVILFGASTLVVAGDGYPMRIPDAARAYLAADSDRGQVRQRCAPLRDLLGDDEIPAEAGTICRIGERMPSLGEPVDLMLWGDSHAAAVRPAFAEHVEANESTAFIAVLAACPPAVGIAWKGLSRDDALVCEARNEAVIRVVERGGVNAVLMVGHWDIYADADGEGGSAVSTGGPFAPSAVTGTGARALHAALATTVLRLAEHGSVRLMLDVPSQPVSVPQALAAEARWPWVPRPDFVARKDAMETRAGAVAILKELEREEAVAVIDPLDVICPKDRDSCVTLVGDRPLYLDADHLSATGAAYLFDQLPELTAAPEKDSS